MLLFLFPDAQASQCSQVWYKKHAEAHADSIAQPTTMPHKESSAAQKATSPRRALLFLNDLGSKFASSSAIGKTLANAFMSPPFTAEGDCKFNNYC